MLLGRTLSVILSLLAVPLAAATSSSTTRTLIPEAPGVIGAVEHVARARNTVFVHGEFSSIAPVTGGGLIVDAADGHVLRPFPRVAGSVQVAIPDGAGGWYIGGSLNGVEGVPQSKLAHLLADGTVVPWQTSFNELYPEPPAANPNRIAPVNALALKGNVLYVGGRFTEANGQSRRGLVALDARTGALLAWDPQCDGDVAVLAIRGQALYVGGRFGQLGGVARTNAGALDLRTAAATAWHPATNRGVLAIAFRTNTAFLGGEFQFVNGLDRNLLAEVDLETGAPTAWSAGFQPTFRSLPVSVWPFVAAVAVHGRTVYAGGEFASVGGVARGPLVALDAETGESTAFDATHLSGRVRTLAIQGNALYAGGILSSTRGESRSNAAAAELRTGRLLHWQPRPRGEVRTIAVQSARAYVGGGFNMEGETRARAGAAAFDAHTWELLDWSPVFAWEPFRRGSLVRMFAFDDVLYVSGPFTAVDGQPRTHLAAFDVPTGALLPWSVPVNVAPTCLRRIGSRLYLGGDFTIVNGVARNRLAAIDAASGAVLDWDPYPRGAYPSVLGKITAMDVYGSTVYVAGEFDFFHDVPRRDFAALDAFTGIPLAWDTEPGFDQTRRPDGPGPSVYALSAGDDGVFAGGWWQRILRREQVSFAAFDANGALRNADLGLDAPSWIVGHAPQVIGLERHAGWVYAAGRFDEVGPYARVDLCAIDPDTGVPDEWYTAAMPWARGGGLLALDIHDDVLYSGGWIRGLAGYPVSGFAAIALSSAKPTRAVEARSAAPAGSQTLALAAPAPNPSHDETWLRWSLPVASKVTLEVFDPQGRRIASLLRDDVRAAGPHEMKLRTEGWREGVYYTRLTAGAQRAVRKLVVLR